MKGLIAGLLAALVCMPLSVPMAAEVAGFKILKLDGNNVRWQRSKDGQSPVVSYKVVASAVDSPGARNCRKIRPLDGLLTASRISGTSAHEEIVAAFAMWEAVADIKFKEATPEANADILIGAQVEPEGWAFADVFYDAASTERLKPISKALICLNPERRWKVGFDGDLRAYDLRYTIAHEIGHAIGLDHPSGGGTIMGYRYEEHFRVLQPGDVQGATLIYGQPRPADVAEAEAERNAAERLPPWLAKRGGRAFTAPAAP